MKLKIACFLIIALIAIISTTSYSAYFYNDKQFSDILMANKLVYEWAAVSESQIPQKLKPLAITKDDIDGKKICLVPFTALLFNNDETFTYLWTMNSSNTGEISGKWRVENSTLIFTLGKGYSSVYKKDSELRYKVTKVVHSGNSLKYSCASYLRVPGIIKTTNDPLKDFADIVVSMEKENIKNSLKNNIIIP